MISLPNLHDATLKSVNFDWVRGVVQLAFKTDVAFSSVIEASEVTELKCPRLSPWGPSSSVNSVAHATLAYGHYMTVEMQSGDVLEIHCGKVSVLSASE